MFCGNSSFWDQDLLVNNSWPEFTQCFQETLLSFLPCCWLLFTSVVLILFLKHFQQSVVLPTSWIFILKLFLCVSLSTFSLIDMAAVATQTDSSAAFYVSRSFFSGSFLLSGFLVSISYRRGLASPCVINIFWICSIISWTIFVYTSAMHKDYRSNLLHFCILCLTWSLLICQFILHCVDERKFMYLFSANRNHCPVNTASFSSKILFSWMTRLIYKGYKQTLQITETFDLPLELKSESSTPRFLKIWKRKLEKTGFSPRKENKSNIYDGTEVSEKSPLLNNEAHSSSTASQRNEKSPPSVYTTLWKVFFPKFLKVSLVGAAGDALLFVNTLLLDEVINYTENRSHYYKWQGLFMAAAFFCITMIYALMNVYRAYNTGNIAMQVKASLMCSVYKKALTLNAESRRKFTVGTIVNLMAVDSAKFEKIIQFSWVLFSSPVVLGLGFYMLYTTLDLAFITGVVVIVVFIPITTKISAVINKAQSQQLKFKDQRIKLTNELLKGIKVVKLYAWELSFQNKISKARESELIELRRAAIYISIATLCWFISPVLVVVLTYLTYIIISDLPLTPAKAFVAMTILNWIRNPINTIPQFITSMAEVHVSAKRLQDFLSGEDLQNPDVSKDEEDCPIVMKNATFKWTRDLPATLTNLNFYIAPGKLTAIIGQVGSGKSSLLSAMLGEMEKVSGTCYVKGRKAYVPQEAWIQNLSLKDNILFGQTFSSDKFWNVINACALKTDLDILPCAEMTEIGEKGINLSGGQKQRVSLGRAIYQDADVYFLDDPLSAVDAHVGKHIFQQVLGSDGLLKNKTRVLVTHGIHWLPRVDNIIVMEDGRIREMGSYQDLIKRDGPFAQFIRSYLNEHQAGSIVDEDELKIREEIYELVESVSSENSPLHKRQISYKSQSSQLSEKSDYTKASTSLKSKSRDKKSATQLIEEEKSQSGKISSSVLMSLMTAFGYLVGVACLGTLVFYQGFNIGSGIWLSKWTDDSYLRNVSHASSDKYTSETVYYMGIYALFSFFQVLGNGVYILLVFLNFISASRRLHRDMLDTILHQNMNFFDTTPMGRILNRFSRDIDAVDANLAHLCRITLHNVFQILSTAVIISYTTPLFLAAAVPIFILYVLLQKFYIPSSRQLQRIQSTTRSPIFSHFMETINGASSIRAYKASERFYQTSQNFIDTNNACVFAVSSASRWLRVRLELLGAAIVVSAALFAVLSDDMSGGSVGLSVSFALQVTAALNQVVVNGSTLETDAVSVERIVEYSKLPHEPEWVNLRKRPESEWPQSGEIEFREFSTRYRGNLDLVLSKVSLTINPGERVGIVGRTGAGKSSLSMALFRVIEAAGGKIMIDGVDISSIGLHDLRSRLTILPQDPVLFSGSLRTNLDPTDAYTDSDIWDALEHAHLKDFVNELPDRLDFIVEEGGQNFSAGQRQLLCLSRCLLRKSRILLLDEATSSVDQETDALVQTSLRASLYDSTLLTVAHRLNTVIDYDRILVLSKGEVCEFDSPKKLTTKQGLLFLFHGQRI